MATCGATRSDGKKRLRLLHFFNVPLGKDSKDERAPRSHLLGFFGVTRRHCGGRCSGVPFSCDSSVAGKGERGACGPTATSPLSLRGVLTERKRQFGRVALGIRVQTVWLHSAEMLGGANSGDVLGRTHQWLHMERATQCVREYEWVLWVQRGRVRLMRKGSGN